MSEESSDPVRVQRQEAIALVTMNEPQRRNALSARMVKALLDVFASLAGDKTCRAIVLTGSVGCFSAGGDLAAMRTRSTDYMDRRLALGGDNHALVRAMVAGPKPVVAVVDGPAFGAGLALVTASDYVVASPGARFCAAQLRVGLLPDMGLYWTLKERLGGGVARELILLARELNAEEAAQLRLVNRVAEQALEAGIEVAGQFARLPPVSMALAKAALAEGSDTLADTLKSERDCQPMLYRSRDHQEALAAFFEKRKPVFTGE